jgi:hypothetical protein
MPHFNSFYRACSEHARHGTALMALLIFFEMLSGDELHSVFTSINIMFVTLLHVLPRYSRKRRSGSAQVVDHECKGTRDVEGGHGATARS